MYMTMYITVFILLCISRYIYTKYRNFFFSIKEIILHIGIRVLKVK